MTKEDIRQLVLEMMECPMFRGEYDAKHGNESFMYGISTVMEYLASRVGDAFYQGVSDVFTHNMVKKSRESSGPTMRVGLLFGGALPVVSRRISAITFHYNIFRAKCQ